MIALLSKKMTCFFVRKNAIEESEREVYNYCFEILLSTVLNLVAVIIIAICTKTYVTSLLFIVAFMTMRAVAGGYHANTHFRCFLILMTVYVTFILIIKLLHNVMTIGIVFNFLSFILYFIFAPVDSDNNVIRKADRRKLKIKSIIFTLILSTISFIMLLIKIVSLLGFALAYGNIAVAVSCCCALIKKVIYRNENVKQGTKTTE